MYDEQYLASTLENKFPHDGGKFAALVMETFLRSAREKDMNPETGSPLQDRRTFIRHLMAEGAEPTARFNLAVIKRVSRNPDQLDKMRQAYTRWQPEQMAAALPNSFRLGIIFEEQTRTFADRIKQDLAALDLNPTIKLLEMSTDDSVDQHAVIDRVRLTNMRCDAYIECRSDPNIYFASADFAMVQAYAASRPYFVAYTEDYEGPRDISVLTLDISGISDAERESAIRTAFGPFRDVAAQRSVVATSTAIAPAGPNWPDIAGKISRYGLVVFVGGDLPERQSGLPTDQTAFAADLLIQASLMADDEAEPIRREALVSSRWAGFLNRLVLTTRSDEISAWKGTLAKRIRSRGGVVKTLVSLAELVKRVPPAPPTRKPVVVITTNVDLTVEHAFIEAGLDFVARVIPPFRDGKEQPVYTAAFVKGKPGGANGYSEPSVETLPADRRRDYLHDFEPAPGGPSEDDYLRRRIRDDLIDSIYLQAETDARNKDEKVPDPTLPILIKVNGSCHETGDFVVSVDEERLVESRPNDALSRDAVTQITNATVLTVGYGLADPPLMDLHATVIRSPFKVPARAPRIAIVDPGDFPPRNPRKEDAPDRLRRHGENLGFTVIAHDPNAGLLSLAKAYGDAARTA